MWLQLDADVFEDDAIAALPAAQQLVWIRLLCTAKRHCPGGTMRGSLARGDALAVLWATDGLDAVTVSHALRSLQGTGQVTIDAAGTLQIVRWPEYQRDPTNATRAKRHRRKRAKQDQDRNGIVTLPVTVPQRVRNSDVTLRQGQGQGQGDPESTPLSGSTPRTRKRAPLTVPAIVSDRLATYAAAYQRTHGRAPLARGPADRSAIGRMLSACPADCPGDEWPARLDAAIARYVADRGRDEWLMRQAHPLTWLAKNLSAYLATNGAVRAPLFAPPPTSVLEAAAINRERDRVLRADLAAKAKP